MGATARFKLTTRTGDVVWEGTQQTDEEGWALVEPPLPEDLADGTYDVSVTATDTLGNAGTDASVNELTVDTTAPQTTITSGPSGLTNDKTPSFGFSANEGGSSFDACLTAAA